MAPRTLDVLADFIAKSAYPSNYLYNYSILRVLPTVVPTLKTRLGQRSKDNGAPTLLFISSAALRVTDATRVLKSKTLRGEKGGDVAKLFARHFKLEEHVAYLKRSKIGSGTFHDFSELRRIRGLSLAAAGTPGRIGKLLCETGMYIWHHVAQLRRTD